MADDVPVMVRRSVRIDVLLQGRASVAPAHAQRVRLSNSAPQRDGQVEVDVVDLSINGIGFISQVFFPKRTLLKLVVMNADPAAPPLLTAVGRVQRSVMTDRRPAYMHGVAFEDLTREQMAEIDAVINRLSGG